jgi:crotonobetainyl-CoA:carnitine CoA-transferase CaiB-like acyl-CoA transferase
MGESVDAMNGPLTGIKVLELAMWAAGPAAGAMMADWGAEVIKIEPPEGDPYRIISSGGRHLAKGEVSAKFQLDNRGKRSISINLKTAQGRKLAHDLVRQVDVFLTNLRSPALEQFEMGYKTLSEINPALIYTFSTGYGIEGPDRDKAAFDAGAFWARAGVAASVLSPDADPLFPAGAIGDHTVALSSVTGTCAALVARNTTGKGQLVVTSLMRAGTYFVCSDLFQTMQGQPHTFTPRSHSVNPMINCYRDSQGKWFWLLGTQGDRAWPKILKAIGRDDLAGDSRFDNQAKRQQRAPEVVALLDDGFRSRTLAEWIPIFDREDVWWSPVQTLAELLDDPQAQAGGVFTNAPTDGGTLRMPSGPVDFHGTPWKVRSLAPELGEHTEQTLLEMGCSWDDIARLKSEGVIP